MKPRLPYVHPCNLIRIGRTTCLFIIGLWLAVQITDFTNAQDHKGAAMALLFLAAFVPALIDEYIRAREEVGTMQRTAQLYYEKGVADALAHVSKNRRDP